MRSLAVTVVLVAAIINEVISLKLHPQGDMAPSVMRLGIQRRAVEDHIEHDALRRRQTVSQKLDNELALYFANVTVGTPSQDIRLHIDTGSSDMWVNTPNSEICQYRRGPCSSTGTYNPNSSSTYNYLTSDFNVSYVDGSGASGDYVTDNVGIGGETLNDLQFGVGYISSTPQGILGIGFAANEAQVNRNGQESYSNMPQAMVDAGLIRSNAYSIWLDDLEASTGSILFGGVDTDKYRGSLQSLPVQTIRGRYSQFVITLSGMILRNDGDESNLAADLPTPVFLDTGSSLTYLPPDLVQSLFEKLNVQYSSRSGAGYIYCSLADQNITVDFVFSTVTISVPISELIINPTQTEGGNGQTYSGESSLCLFGITATETNAAVLGDTFLRSAYVVYDMDNNEISIAQTNFDSDATTVSDIDTGSDGVPNATVVKNPVQASATQTGGGIIGGTATATASAGSGCMRILDPSPFIMSALMTFVILLLCW